MAQTICVGLTLSCLPHTGCCALLQAPEAPLLSQLISSPMRGLPQMRKPLLFFSSPPTRGAGPIPLPFLFLFPSSFFWPTWLCGDISCPFRCLRSSVSVQQVLCENSSICRFILAAFVGRDELHILLLLHHLDLPLCHFNYNVSWCCPLWVDPVWDSVLSRPGCLFPFPS